jgi:hypothetical protein
MTDQEGESGGVELGGGEGGGCLFTSGSQHEYLVLGGTLGSGGYLDVKGFLLCRFSAILELCQEF